MDTNIYGKLCVDDGDDLPTLVNQPAALLDALEAAGLDKTMVIFLSTVRYGSGVSSSFVCQHYLHRPITNMPNRIKCFQETEVIPSMLKRTKPSQSMCKYSDLDI